MSWKKLSLFAIIILVVLNIVFSVLVFSEYSKVNFYDAESVSELVSILDQGGITLDTSLLPKKRTNMNVYTSRSAEDDFESAVRAFTGGNIEKSGDGFKSVIGKGEYTVSRDFSFVYRYDNFSQVTSRLYDVTDKAVYDKTVKYALDFLNIRGINSSQANKNALHQAEYKAESVRTDGGTYFSVMLCEYFEKEKTGNTVEISVSGEKVVYAVGKLMFVLPREVFSARNLDILSIMIKEKRYFEQADVDGKISVSSVDYAYDSFRSVISHSRVQYRILGRNDPHIR